MTFPAPVEPPTDTSHAGHRLAAKVAQIAKQIEALEKTGRNEEQHYNYARDSDIVAAVRGPMNEAGVAIFPSVVPGTIVVTPGLGRHGNVILTTLICAFKVVDSESGEFEICNYPGAGSDTGDKGVFKAMTGATKYLYQKLFNIPVHEPAVEPETPGGEDLSRADTPHSVVQNTAPGKPETQAEKIARVKREHEQQAQSNVMKNELPPPNKPGPSSVVRGHQSAQPAAGTPVLVKGINVKRGENAKGKWALYIVTFTGKVKADDGSVTSEATTFSDTIALEAEHARDHKTPVMPIISTGTNRGKTTYKIESLTDTAE